MNLDELKDQLNRDRLTSIALWGVAGGALAATLTLGDVLSRELKYAALATGLGASIGVVVYETLESTKILRAQGKQARNHELQISAGQFANALDRDVLALRASAEAETLQTINALPAEVRETMMVGIGSRMDTNPQTAAIDVPVKPVVSSPVAIAKKAGASNQLQLYVDFLTKKVISKLGKRPSSFLFLGATRDGKSTLCQLFVYAVALHSIALQNRLVCTVLVQHGIDRQSTDPFHPLWNGLPEKLATDELESAVVKVSPESMVGYVRSLHSELEHRITHDDYSWNNPQSMTPTMILVIDDATNLFRPLDDSTKSELAAQIAHIAQDGSKYGVFIWLLMQDATKDRTGIDPGAWASMQTVYGYKALKKFAPKGLDKDDALAQMEQSRAKTGGNAAGYWSEEIGYMPPPAISSVRELTLAWEVPAIDVFDAQVSMVNMLRDRVADAHALGDATLISFAMEFSTFTRDEIQQNLANIRVLLKLPTAEYERRVNEARANLG